MEQAGCFSAVLSIAALVLAIVGVVTARSAVARFEGLQTQLDFANQLIAELRRRMDAMRSATRESSTTGASEEIGKTEAPVASAAASSAVASTPEPFVPPVVPPVVPISVPVVQEPPIVPIEETLPTESQPVAAFVAEAPAAQSESPLAASPETPASPAPPPLTPPISEPIAAPAAQSAPAMSSPPVPPRGLSSIDWESVIGVKLFSWVAGFALLIAAIFLFRYTIDNGWLTPTIRMIIGLVVGTALLVVCELRFAKNYRTTANAMDGAGVAILYSTLFAAHSVWHLLPALVVFGLMILVTGVAVLLSLRRDSIFIAILGLVGGFATPALLSSGEDRPIGLFSYLLLLNVGLSVVAYRKKWAPLTVLSFVFTVIYQWAWVMRFLDHSKVSLATGIFLLFPLIGVIALMVQARREPDVPATFRRTNALAMVMPLLFALYVASKPALSASPNLLFGFLSCIVIGLTIVAAAKIGNTFLHTTGAVATLLIVAVWMVQNYTAAAWPYVLFWLLLIMANFLLAPVIANRFHKTLGDDGWRGATAGALLLFAFALLPVREAATSTPWLLFVVALSAVVLAAISTIALRQWRVYLIASAMLLATLAAWSQRFLDPAHLTSALILYVVTAVLFTAAPLILRNRDPLLRRTDSHGWLLAGVIAELLFVCKPDVANLSLVAVVAILSAVAVAAALITAASRSALPLVVTAIASWIALAVWFVNGDLAHAGSGVIAAIAFFSVVLTAVTLWRLAAKETLTGGEQFYALGGPLVGYAFLFVVALTPSLTDPPLPLYSALLVMVGAIGIVGVVVRRAGVHVVSVTLAEIVLFSASCASTRFQGPTETVLFQLLLIAVVIAFAELSPARRSAAARPALLAASLGALLIGQIVVVATEQQVARPAFLLILAATVAILVTTMVLARLRDVDIAPFIAVAPAAAAYVVWREGVPRGSVTPGWGEAMLFASVVYLLFIFGPILFADRSRRRMLPYAAAALASLPFFLFARNVLVSAGFGDAIGLLPVCQAALMGVLLLHLLRLEPAGQRDTSRLVLVAATALAFVTVAIPLQLEKQWITVGWALEAAALAWLNRRVPHRALPIASAALATVVFIRLAANPAVLSYHARTATPVFNWYLYAYSVAAAALFLAARQLWLGGDRSKRIPWLCSLATVLAFLLVNIEIADYYSKGSTLTFNFSATLAQDLTYTIAWGIFAIVMLITGIALHNRAARVAAIGLLVITVFKCFLHDLGQLGGLYRVGAFVGLAVCLLAVALLLQRFILTPRDVQGGAG